MSLCELHQATSDGELVCPIASSISFAKKKKSIKMRPSAELVFKSFSPVYPRIPGITFLSPKSAVAPEHGAGLRPKP